MSPVVAQENTVDLFSLVLFSMFYVPFALHSLCSSSTLCCNYIQSLCFCISVYLSFTVSYFSFCNRSNLALYHLIPALCHTVTLFLFFTSPCAFHNICMFCMSSKHLRGHIKGLKAPNVIISELLNYTVDL